MIDVSVRNEIKTINFNYRVISAKMKPPRTKQLHPSHTNTHTHIYVCVCTFGFGMISLFNGISDFVDYLMPKLS